MIEKNGGVTLRLNIEPHLRKIAVAKNRPITKVYVSQQTGLSYDTVARLPRNRRVAMSTLSSLLDFLRAEGLTDVTVGDLFEELPANGQEPTE